jgi:queuine tRNA-ribosyltransferase
MSFTFSLDSQDGAARTGSFTTPHGVVQTPVFMPVGTQGAVKGVSPAELQAIGSQIILGNTYHLHLRPGEDTVAAVGGLHEFMQWSGPILTDSGGFQVFSLGERGMRGDSRQPLRDVAEDGITFRSHLDGSTHFMSPEDSIRIQQALGADIIMAFDQPVYGLSSESEAEAAMERTHRWLERSAAQWRAGRGDQALFGIVQGGTHTRLHTASAAFIAAQDLPGNAIGGLSVGEAKLVMWEALRSMCAQLPEHKPRYVMGLGGEPEDLIEAVKVGSDMMDCVAPARLARHGVVWEVTGPVEAFWAGDWAAVINAGALAFPRRHLSGAVYAAEAAKLSSSSVLPGSVGSYPLASLRHFLRTKEMMGYRVLTLHNIAVLHQVMKLLRWAIAEKQLHRI